MIYAEFYHNSTGYVAGSIPPRFDAAHIRPIPACGSHSVARLDGRRALESLAAEAREICRKRGWLGFTLNRGETYSRSRSREVRRLELI